MPPCTLYTSLNPRSTNTDAACADRTPAAHNTYVGLVGSNSLSATALRAHRAERLQRERGDVRSVPLVLFADVDQVQIFKGIRGVRLERLG